MKILSQKAFFRAGENLKEVGRDIEKTLFQYYFEGGDRGTVLEALSKFQNADGGFGQGLESDFRMPQSTPMATSVGLRIIREVEAFAEGRGMIRRAVAYIENTFDQERAGWYAVTEDVNNFPRTPWWRYDVSKGMTVIDQNWGNPSAELISYLHILREFVSKLPVDALIELAIKKMEEQEHFSSEHELYCYLNLYRLLSGNMQGRLEKKLKKGIETLVEYDREKWQSYVPTPLDFVPDPRGEQFGVDQSKIQEQLDYYIDEINEKGLVEPPWGKEFYTDGLTQAYHEWQGVLTLNVLRTLFLYGRIEILTG